MPKDNETTARPIVDRIADFIAQYVVLPHKSLYRLVALWVVATHMHSDFDYMGYLFAHSAMPQSGKSRLLEVLDLIVYKPSGVLVSPTEAVLFRTATDQTQLIDEADSCQQLDALRGVLNAGFHKGGSVKRMEKDEEGNYHPVAFQVYGPRALAGIGVSILDQTTRDRTFMIQMVPRKGSERGRRFRLLWVKPEADAVRAEIERWVGINRAEVVSTYNAADFEYLTPFRDRTIDVTEPLAAILEVVFARATQEPLTPARLEFLEAVTLTRGEQESPAFESRVLAALAALAEKSNPLVASASELVTMLKGSVEGLTEYNLADVLRRHGFEPKSVRKDGGDPRYRYVLPLGSLVDLAERYLGRRPPSSVVSEVVKPKGQSASA